MKVKRMTIRGMKQQTRLREWQNRIQQQKADGLTIRQWCKENGCSEGKYYYWLKQVREKMLEQMAPSSMTLVQVEPDHLPMAATKTATQNSSFQTTERIIIHYGNVRVVLPGTTVAANVAQLLKLLCHV